MASDTWGNVSATRFRKTVSERRIVTPARITNMERTCGQNKIAFINAVSLSFALFLHCTIGFDYNDIFTERRSNSHLNKVITSRFVVSREIHSIVSMATI